MIKFFQLKLEKKQFTQTNNKQIKTQQKNE